MNVSLDGPDRPLAEWVRAWASRYPDSHDERIAHLDGASRLGRADWEAVAHWKFEQGDRRRLTNAQNGIAAIEDDEVLELLSRTALITTDDALAHQIIQVPGSVGPALGSALLMVARPDHYTVYDVRATASLLSIDGHLSRRFPQRWLDYLKACRHIGHRCQVSLRTVDRALYMANGRDDMPDATPTL